MEYVIASLNPQTLGCTTNTAALHHEGFTVQYEHYNLCNLVAGIILVILLVVFVHYGVSHFFNYYLTVEIHLETTPLCNSRTRASVQTNNKYAMADSFTSRRGEMKDSASLSETGSDKGDDSQGIKDDVFENDSGYIEERFRVDRKKLEQMLQGLTLFFLTVPLQVSVTILYI